MISHSELMLNIMRDDIFNLIPGTVNTRQGAAVASYSPTVAPMLNKDSFEDMLAKEANFTPSHQPRHGTFADTVQGGLTSTPHNFHEEVALPPRTNFQSNPEEVWLHRNSENAEAKN